VSSLLRAANAVSNILSVLLLDRGIPSSLRSGKKLLNRLIVRRGRTSLGKIHPLIIEPNEVLDLILPASIINEFHDAMEEGLVVKLRSARPCNKAFLMTEGVPELNYWRILAACGELLTIALILNYLSRRICYR